MATLFGLDSVPMLQPRYNIAPSQPVGAVVQSRETSAVQFRHFQWGLVPKWAKNPTVGNRMINARSETVAEKPAFRSALKYRRCLVPADGFYEWKKNGRSKQPYYITLADGGLFAFAGLWEHWQGANGEEIESCAILTTDANDLMHPIHPRMPVILPPHDYSFWLDCQVQDSRTLTPLLRPLDADRMHACPVSTFVNNPRQEGERCVRRQESDGLFDGTPR